MHVSYLVGFFVVSDRGSVQRSFRLGVVTSCHLSNQRDRKRLTKVRETGVTENLTVEPQPCAARKFVFFHSADLRGKQSNRFAAHVLDKGRVEEGGQAYST